MDRQRSEKIVNERLEKIRLGSDQIFFLEEDLDLEQIPYFGIGQSIAYHKRKAADIKKTIICSSSSDFCWVVVFFFIGSRSAEQCKSWLQPLCKSFFLKRKVEATKAIIAHSLAMEVRRKFKKNLNKTLDASVSTKYQNSGLLPNQSLGTQLTRLTRPINGLNLPDLLDLSMGPRPMPRYEILPRLVM